MTIHAKPSEIRDGVPEQTDLPPLKAVAFPSRSASRESQKRLLIETRTFYYDPVDPDNQGLYLCSKRPLPKRLVNEITGMRMAELWTARRAEMVPESLRQVFRSRLWLLEDVTYKIGFFSSFTIARLEHTEFPSSDRRWEDWKRFFDSRYKRVKD